MRYANGGKMVSFTQKQVNVIYALNKQGIIKVKNKTLNRMYDLLNYCGSDTTNYIQEQEASVNLILDSIFKKDYKEAQFWIKDFEESIF